MIDIPFPSLVSLTLPLNGKPKFTTSQSDYTHLGMYGPVILGLPSSSKPGIVQLNSAVQFAHKHSTPNPVMKPPIEYTKDHHSLKYPPEDILHITEVHRFKASQPLLPPLHSWEDLIKAYHGHFKGIGMFSGTYHITLRDDVKPVINAPRNCPIAMQNLVCDKLDGFIYQGIIVPVTEPTDWVSSLVYSWKANSQAHLCLDPRDLAIKQGDHYRTPVVEDITHGLAGSTCFKKLDGTSSYQCIVFDCESSSLTMGIIPFHPSYLGPGWCTRHIPMYDGPVTWPLWLCNWDCRWGCHPWQGWWRTWQMPLQADGSDS